MILSPRFKHAFKTALAVVIAYGIALYMDWDKPIWAGYTAASISLDDTGQSIQKGLNRITGAVVGSIFGFILLAFFIQDRWLFYTFLSLHVAVCTYFSFGTERYNYFWQQAGFFAVVVGLDSAFSPVSAFDIAIARAQGAGTGLLVYMLVGLLLWPTNSRSSLEDAAKQLTA
ncbi:MAG: FUSC family protein, partial [Desulfobacterales bacterium]